MEAEITRLKQQSAGLQGKLLLSAQQASELKIKIESAESDARARADEAARAAREGAEHREKAAASDLVPLRTPC